MALLLTLAFWLVYTGLMAWGQGWLMPALKLTPDKTPQSNRQQFALHWIFGAVWALPLAWCVYIFRSWEPVAIAALVRFVFFDPLLNYTEGNPAIPVFAVGSSSNTDKLLQWVAANLRVPVTVLSAILRAAGILILVAFVWVKC